MTTPESKNRSTGIEWTEHTWNPTVGKGRLEARWP